MSKHKDKHDPEESLKPPERRFNRRTLLRGALGAGGLLVLGGIVSSERGRIREAFHGPSPANAFVDAFPSAPELPAVERIDVHRVPGARHCLIHIRQFHGVENMSEEQRAKMTGSQNEIETLLIQLMDHPAILLSEVYDEGNTPLNASNQAFIDESEKFTDALSQGLDEMERAEEASTREKLKDARGEIADIYRSRLIALERSRKEREARKERNKPEAPQTLSAVDRVRKSRKLKVAPSETIEANARGHAAMMRIAKEKKGGEAEWKAVTTDREMILLAAAARREQPAFAVYGAGHRFMDSIRQWNAEHPEDMFSLIELTTKTVAEDDRKP